MSQRDVKTVVIPVAGMGTRFLPATKSLPKEMLPIVDRPIIHIIVEEAVRAGIENVVFITSRPKVAIEDYFDPADLTSYKLEAAGKLHLIEETIELSKKINIVSVRQYEPKGLGHAVLQAAPAVGKEPFAVLLGDDIVVANSGSALKDCTDVFKKKSSGSVVGVFEVDPAETHKYGVVGFGDQSQPEACEVKEFIEKPSPEEAPSNWALPGRYVFENEIFDALRETPPGKGDEIQLTDAMISLLKRSPFWATKLEAERFDTGSKLGYIMANVAFALKDKDEGEKLRNWLKNEIKN
jgi:UTP--glucose-1-phosphate uridylyltransferase